jgi:DNA-binding transcriptional regulator GbsR (MarR family)
MMGVLLGTLNKFKDEISQPNESLKKREEIDNKLAEKRRLEKEESEKIRALEREKRKERNGAMALRRKQEQEELLSELVSIYFSVLLFAFRN